MKTKYSPESLVLIVEDQFLVVKKECGIEEDCIFFTWQIHCSGSSGNFTGMQRSNFQWKFWRKSYTFHNYERDIIAEVTFNVFPHSVVGDLESSYSVDIQRFMSILRCGYYHHEMHYVMIWIFQFYS